MSWLSAKTIISSVTSVVKLEIYFARRIKNRIITICISYITSVIIFKITRSNIFTFYIFFATLWNFITFANGQFQLCYFTIKHSNYLVVINLWVSVMNVRVKSDVFEKKSLFHSLDQFLPKEHKHWSSKIAIRNFLKTKTISIE